MAEDLAYLNLKTPIVEKDGTPTRTFWSWLNLSILTRLQNAAYAIPAGVVSLTAQAATISATAIVTLTSVPRYRISWMLRVTRAASVSSGATVTIRWTQGGVSQAYTAVIVDGNLTTSMQLDQQILIHPDGATVVTYEVLYASVGGTTMTFELDVLAEATA